MAYLGPIRRWEIYGVDVAPHVGSERGGDRRPALIVSNDGCNARFEVVTIVPLTGRDGKRREAYPFEGVLPDLVGNGRESLAMPHQVRTISRRRILERFSVLTDPGLLAEVENRLLEHLGIDFEVRES